MLSLFCSLPETDSSVSSTSKSAVWGCYTTNVQVEKSADAHGKPVRVKKAKCNTCSKEFVIKRLNTSNLWSHLETNHLSVYLKHVLQKMHTSKLKKRCTDSSAPSASGSSDLKQMFLKAQPYVTTFKEYKERTGYVLDYIIGDGRPLSTIESERFKQMVNKLDPRYKLPSRRTLCESVLPTRYNAMRKDVLKHVHEAKHSGDSVLAMFSFTTDLWSSSCMDPYMFLTIHFIDKSFNLQSFTLENTYIPDSHTGVNLAAVLLELLEYWQLDKNHLRSITTDSAANLIKMGSEAGICRMPCFGHLLHNAVRNSQTDPRIARVTGKVKRIVAYFHQSHKRQKPLELKKSGKTMLHLTAECPTRWGSTYDMYSKLQSVISEVKRVVVEDASHLVPNHDDLQVLESVCEALAD